MKKKNFKVGNIVQHSISRNDDSFTYNDGERRFQNRQVFHEQETLLIVGYENSSFIVYAMQGDIKEAGRRKYFNYGGFERCFKMLAKYVNDNCTPVSV
jgi:hypothetical protein